MQEGAPFGAPSRFCNFRHGPGRAKCPAAASSECALGSANGREEAIDLGGQVLGLTRQL